MIDVKTTKESLELLRFIKLPTDEQNNALSNVLGVVEQVLSAKVPTKYHVQENIIEETNVLSNRESARKGWNDCHDQFTALIARDYVYRDKLPTEENLHKYYLEVIKTLKPESFTPNANKPFNELTDEQNFIDNFISKSIREMIEKGYE